MATLEALEGISRTKVIDVLVEVITDRAKDVGGRESIRSGAGNGPQKVRHDRARAWRCALQLNSPSARRLHFWTLPDYSVELDQVGVHDDAIRPECVRRRERTAAPTAPGDVLGLRQVADARPSD